MDFAPNNYGDDPFPKAIPPSAATLRWQNSDWDPSLRFWTLGWDPNLVQWLRDEDTSQPSIMAAREFAKEFDKWKFDEDELVVRGWLIKDVHLAWKYGNSGTGTTALTEIQKEIEQLFQMMEDDRDRYLAEINAQADGLAAYIISFLGVDSERKPHTIDLIRCGLAIGNLVYMNYKETFRRVRASTICPGLVPPFGPPRHPSFPSGHSFLGHFIALLLLEIDEIAKTFGEKLVGDPPPIPPAAPAPTPPPPTLPPSRGQAELVYVMNTAYVFNGPLLWLGDRLARNRERAGLHYPSDSLASQWIAGALWALLTKSPPPTPNPQPTDQVPKATPPAATNPVQRKDLIHCPTLKRVLHLAKAEWAS